jgi:hypothetical protein
MTMPMAHVGNIGEERDNSELGEGDQTGWPQSISFQMMRTIVNDSEADAPTSRDLSAMPTLCAGDIQRNNSEEEGQRKNKFKLERLTTQI